MTDLRSILPSFPTSNFASLIPAIEQHALTTTDLLTLHPADIAKQTHLPLLDLKRFIAAVQASLFDDLTATQLSVPTLPAADDVAQLSLPALSCISTLDDDLDAALGGGIPVGRITEFAGESGAGKTQFLLSLCLAVQLPAPRGLGKQALYISTESGLSTSRLAQMLRVNETLSDVDLADRPSLDSILSTALPDLESQDHILQYQVPVLLERHNVGLIVLDSVAANYRAEFERQGNHGSNMAARSSDLVRLGALLRDLARRHNLAVVVANQVADRFSTSPMLLRGSHSHRHQQQPPRPSPAAQETPLASRSHNRQAASAAGPSSSLPFQSTPATPFSFPDEDNAPPAPPALLLDHQQRWFTGWGDDPRSSLALKTPSLGLVWSTQLSCRIALFKKPVYGRTRTAAPVTAGLSSEGGAGGGDNYDPDMAAPTLKSWRRWMKVVFAHHAKASGNGIDGAVEFEITLGGLKAVKRGDKKSKLETPL